MKKTNSHLYQYHHRRCLGPATAADIAHTRSIDINNPHVDNSTAIILIHGFISSAAVYRDITVGLKNQASRIIAPTLKGHATSIEDTATIHWQSWLEQLRELYQQCRGHYKKVIVVGMSMGGALASLLAAEFADIDHLVLLVPAVYLTPLLKLAPMANKFTTWTKIKSLQYLKTIGGDIKKEGAYELSYYKAHFNVFEQCYRVSMAARSCLEKIKTPTTLIAASHDHVISKRCINKTYEQLACHNKKIIWLENSYHVITLDNEQSQIIDIINSIIKPV